MDRGLQSKFQSDFLINLWVALARYYHYTTDPANIPELDRLNQLAHELMELYPISKSIIVFRRCSS